MNCPIDKDVDLVMSERQGIEIDYCPKCRGVWLDRGELDKLIEKASVQLSPPPPAPAGYPSQQPRHSRDQSYRGDYSRKKKKNLLSELFDF